MALQGDGPAGVPVLRLFAATTAVDTDFTAKLIDVHPHGFAQNLCYGIVRGRFRNGFARPAPLTPDHDYDYTIRLTPTANRFLAGHRIRLDIASASFPRWDRNPNTGDDFGVSARMQSARQTILHDATHPSRVILPIIPR